MSTSTRIPVSSTVIAAVAYSPDTVLDVGRHLPLLRRARATLPRVPLRRFEGRLFNHRIRPSYQHAKL